MERVKSGMVGKVGDGLVEDDGQINGQTNRQAGDIETVDRRLEDGRDGCWNLRERRKHLGLRGEGP